MHTFNSDFNASFVDVQSTTVTRLGYNNKNEFMAWVVYLLWWHF